MFLFKIMEIFIPRSFEGCLIFEAGTLPFGPNF